MKQKKGVTLNINVCVCGVSVCEKEIDEVGLGDVVGHCTLQGDACASS